MSEPKLISPLLDQYVMGSSFSEHHGVQCCPAMTKVTNKRYIVKIISIPASQVQLDALLLAGAYSSKNAALSYYKDVADGIAAEAEILKKLARFEGFVPYEDLQIVEMDDGNVGYQVYLLSPYKMTLERHMQKNPMTQLKAVNLGLDLCASMVMCRRSGYLYVDLKPGNIFINEKNEYCIGDLGFVRLDSLKYASMPDKYRSAYTAPELDDVLASMNETVDIYSIGMILYQIYNDGKLPQSGELIPPAYADYEMAEIIMKAISPDPAQRWQDPMEMGQALVAYMQRNSVNDVPIIPLPDMPAAAPEAAPEDEVPAEPAPAVVDETPVEPVPETPDETAAEPAPETVDETPAEPAPVVADESPAEPTPEVMNAPPLVPEVAPAVAPAGEDATDLTFMDNLVSDDTAPNDDTVGEAAYSNLSDETSDILAQADELLAMEIPEPVVAPEPVEIPMPAPIVLEDEAPEHSGAAPVVIPPASDETIQDPPAEPDPAPEAPPAENDDSSVVSPVVAPVADTTPEPPVANETENPPVEPKKKKNIVGIVALIVAIALMLGALAYGYHYYHNEYLQTVNSLEISGHEHLMFVTLDTDIDESLLTVTATDSYGNSLSGSVSDGVAVFKNLNPDTIYKITVTIDGFHELRGETTGTYTTPAQTKIVHFEATAGNEPGSVILTFTVDGTDTNNWTITYNTLGEEEKSVNFSGHVMTISGLSSGKEYKFILTSADDLYIGGYTTTTFTISSPVFAENLSITQCNADGLVANWNAPEGVEGTVWSIRCYGDDGYDQTLETTDLTVTFTGIDPSLGYTVEVTAKGMSSGVMTHISARSANILDSESDISQPLKLTVTWTFEGDVPLGGWLVNYKVVGTDVDKTVLVTEPTVTIYPAMPGDEYNFTVTAADGITVFNNSFSYTAGPVQVFSGYGVDADDMSFQMCRTPSYSNWDVHDLNSSSYTDTFDVGEKASFVVHLNKSSQVSDDYVDVLFVIRNSLGEIVCTSSTGSSWTYMWDNRYCELDIPTMPTKPGSYSIYIYFNGMAAARDFFTIE